MDKAKSILASKTFWFNALAGLYAFAQSQGLIAAIPAPWGEFIVLGGNMLLRLVSAQPVTLSLPGQPS